MSRHRRTTSRYTRILQRQQQQQREREQHALQQQAQQREQQREQPQQPQQQSQGSSSVAANELLRLSLHNNCNGARFILGLDPGHSLPYHIHSRSDIT